MKKEITHEEKFEFYKTFNSENFKNKYNHKLIIYDHKLIIDNPTTEIYNVSLSYDEIESIELKKNGGLLYIKYGGGKTTVFVIDDKDKDEIKELLPQLKESVISQSNNEDIKKNINKYTRACIGISLFALIFVGVLILTSFFNNVALAIGLAISTLLIITWFSNTRKRIISEELKKFKTVSCVSQILILAILLSTSLFAFFAFKPGFKEGEYLDKTCRWVDCDNPADGGVKRGGLYIPDEYFCKKHFEIESNYDKENNNNKDKNEIDESDVWYEAKEIVKDRLKAPSTASFCSKSSATITKSGNTWTIKGYVDAENSFGAMIRNDFTVVLVFNNDTQYTISNCTITPR